MALLLLVVWLEEHAVHILLKICRTNASNGVCVWNTNLTPAVCQDKSCTSAPNSTTTHNDCYAYYNTASVKCTVAAIPSNSGGNPTL